MTLHNSGGIDCSTKRDKAVGRRPEVRLHYTRYPNCYKGIGADVDRMMVRTLLQSRLGDEFGIHIVEPFFRSKDLGTGLRATLFLHWLTLNDLGRKRVFVVAVRDVNGAVVHRCAVFAADARKGYLRGGVELGVWTDIRYRRRGLAGGVLRAVLESAPGVQFHWLVAQDNVPSVAMIEKMGFHMAGRIQIRRLVTFSRYYC